MVNNREKAPVLFVGHGSPMNAVEDNSYTRKLRELQNLFLKPRAILCISAHWMTQGTWVTHMKRPKTIHDFYGFPKDLFEIQYPAPGSPEVAEEIISEVKEVEIHPDDSKWGLDHGTWSVLRHMYPRAEIPVLQLSLDMSQPVQYHFQIGEKLRSFRKKGIFIIGSGDIVHNLKKIDWKVDGPAFPWALEFDNWVKKHLELRNFKALMEDFHKTEAGRLSVPSLDHYLPTMYVLGASDESDKLTFEYEGIQHGSISMNTFSLRT